MKDKIMENEFELNEEQIQKDLSKYPSEKLADMVIAHRYLGLFKQTCVLAMEELAKRRENGDDFNYEGYIDTNIATLPKLNFGNKEGGSMLDMLQAIKGTINDFKR